MHNCLVASVGWRGRDFDLSLEIFHDLYDALTVAQLMLSPSRVVRAARRGPRTVSGHTPSFFLGSRGGRNVGWWRGQWAGVCLPLSHHMFEIFFVGRGQCFCKQAAAPGLDRLVTCQGCWNRGGVCCWSTRPRNCWAPAGELHSRYKNMGEFLSFSYLPTNLASLVCSSFLHMLCI